MPTERVHSLACEFCVAVLSPFSYHVLLTLNGNVVTVSHSFSWCVVSKGCGTGAEELVFIRSPG